LGGPEGGIDDGHRAPTEDTRLRLAVERGGSL